jgi:hypothetical protein
MTNIGIIVARAILTGDVDSARRLAIGRTSWSVPEIRALAAACRVAKEKWGADVSVEQFMGETT